MTTPFVARAGEVERLLDALARAAEGAPTTVLLGGDAGVGKTRLLAHVAELAAARGATAVTAACVDLGEVGVPYLPVAEALGRLRLLHPTAVDQLLSERPALARLVGSAPAPTGGSGADDEAGRLQLLDGLAAVLGACGRRGAPLLLVLEDVHWADAATRDVVRYLAARLRTEHVLLVLSYRTDDLHRRHPLRPVLAELSRHPRVQRVDMLPFTAEELRAFAVAVRGELVPESLVRTVLDRSEGNAYFAQELLEAGGESVPWSLADVLRTRLDELEAEVLDLARLAAVAGRVVAEPLLRAAWRRRSGHDDARAEVLLRDAVAAHVLAPEDGRIAFRHALLAEVVAADLLPGETVSAHRAYCEALAAEPSLGSHAQLAHHARAAHDLPTAVRASMAAADDAAALLAPQEELQHLETVLELWDAVPLEARPAVGEDDVLVRAAAAAARAGRDERAVALASRAVDVVGTDPSAAEARSSHRSHLARHLLSAERLQDALDVARLAVAELPAAAPSEHRAWAYAVLARCALNVDEDDQARAGAEEAVAVARAGGHPEAEADALATLAVLVVDDPDRAAELLASARDRAVSAGDLLTELRCGYNLAANRFYAGHLVDAAREVDAALGRATQAGLTWHGFAVQLRLLGDVIRYTRGDLTVAPSALEGAPPASVTPLEAVSLYAAVARGDDDVLARVASLQPAAAVDPQVALLAGGCEVDALTLAGRPEDAVDRAEHLIGHMSRAWTDYFLGGIWLAALGLAALADVATAPGATDEQVTAARLRGDALLERAVATAERGRPRGGTLGPEGVAWLARARAEHARLHHAGEVAAWERAAQAFGYGYAYEEARCRFRLAEAWASAGDRTAATTAAASALETARTLGARPLTQALEALGRRARLDLPGGRAAGSTLLTERESEVLRLVARGLSNRQIGDALFISGKTVSVHVSNLLAKLGVSGRAEAVSAAHRRGLIDLDA